MRGCIDLERVAVRLSYVLRRLILRGGLHRGLTISTLQWPGSDGDVALHAGTGTHQQWRGEKGL